MKDFKALVKLAQKRGPKRISVAVAHDEDVLLAIKEAHDLGIIEGVLVGDEQLIRELSRRIGLSLKRFTIINEHDLIHGSEIAVDEIVKGNADILMKGLVDTSIILKAVLKRPELRGETLLSHVAVFEIPTYHKLLMLSDAAMVIAPTLEQKAAIIKNSVEVAKALSISEPKVAILSAKEKVYEKMPSTVDAGKLVEMGERGEITGCILGGPFALDNAISKTAAAHKGIDHPVAGDADILIVPQIESGNILYKALNFLGNATSAGLIVGAKVPIVLTSRADQPISKLNSIVLAALSVKGKGAKA
jgi:phosphate butyryltransferase